MDVYHYNKPVHLTKFYKESKLENNMGFKKEDSLDKQIRFTHFLATCGSALTTRQVAENPKVDINWRTAETWLKEYEKEEMIRAMHLNQFSNKPQIIWAPVEPEKLKEKEKQLKKDLQDLKKEEREKY